MDRYSRALLTVIAAALTSIAWKLWTAPTIGDVIDAATRSPAAALEVSKRAPLIQVRGCQSE